MVMTFELTKNPLNKISADILLLFTFENKKNYQPTAAFNTLDEAMKGELKRVVQKEHFFGKKGSSFTTHSSDVLGSKIMVIGLGKKDDFTTNTLRRAVAQVAKRNYNSVDSIAYELMTEDECSISTEEQSYIVAEAILLGSYSFTHYKQKDEDNDHELSTVIFSAPQKIHSSINKGIKTAELYATGTNLARTLVNEHAAVATPTYLAKIAKDIAKDSKTITCKVFDKAEVEKMGMDAFLGIARAADTPPKFIYLHYKPVTPKNTKRKVAIVGKAITFDSGGINVKPGDYMNNMKEDMAGAAAMLGVFSVIEKIAPDFEVIGLAASTPNMISGSSIVPGDVVRAMNGKTIEVNNTDAEGRVTLSDALSYAVEQGATEIVDLATLTGACLVALGTDIAGLMSNDRNFVQKLKAAGMDAGEELWELPLYEDYKELNKSEVADISNIPAGRWAGTIAAGLFLQEFVDNRTWAHLDIAGPAFAEKDWPIGPKGGTGFGVRLLLNYLQQKQ